MLKVTAHANAQTYYISYVYSALWELAHQGAIQLRFVYPWSLRGRVPTLGEPPMSEALWLVVEDTATGQKRKVCYDHHDKSYDFAHKGLELCDVYYKRSYHQPDIDKLPPALAKKIVPFGFDFPCRSAHDRNAALRAAASYLSHNFDIKRPRASARRAYSMAYYLRSHFRSPIIENFEAAPDTDVQPTILYQTRVYSPGEMTDTTNVNEWRVSLIRALKKEFGDRFVGGLQVNEFSKTHYPDCLTDHKVDRHAFISLVKQNLITIETRGLHYSTSWKMGEYLAASKCIVAEAPHHQPAVPLEDGKHCLFMSTPEEAVEACARILDNPALAKDLRHNAHAYYQQEVNPAVRLKKRLEAVFDYAPA